MYNRARDYTDYKPPVGPDNSANMNTHTPRKHYSDPSETLARMKARLNQSINKYLDEKINNDGTKEVWSHSGNSTPPGGGDVNLSVRSDAGRLSPSPRYTSIMKSNYYL